MYMYIHVHTYIHTYIHTYTHTRVLRVLYSNGVIIMFTACGHGEEV